MLRDDSILIKYKLAGVPSTTIAEKLSITVEEVELRWRRILESQVEAQSGHDELVKQFSILALQYQLVGESLKIISKALSSEASPNEIRAQIIADPDESVKRILNSFIVLHPFKGIDPVESLKEHQKNN